MNRRHFLKLSAAAACLPVLGSRLFGQAPTESSPARPNIILCMTDDQGWGDVSYNGLKAIATPALDAMAANGLRCDRFYAAAPVCSPTRGSMLTGRHPFRYGVFRFGDPLHPKEQTLAQALRGAGYATGHFGKWHLNGVAGPGKPIAGDDPLSPAAFGFDQWFSVSNFFEKDWTFSRNGTPVKTTGDGSDAIVAEAAKFIDAASTRNQPFLAVVWFGNPHLPHQPTDADLRAAGGNAYLGEIAGIDRAMGTLRKHLRDRKIEQNTLLLFCSDNGATGKGSNGPFREGKSSLYEGGVRVPGIIEWPGRIKPAASDVPVCTSDIYPTVLELAGVTVPGQNQPIDGVSLLPLLDGKMRERPGPIGFWYSRKALRPSKAATMPAVTKDEGHAAWTENRYKLHRLPGGKLELYDLIQDRGEKNDLAAAQPELVARMNAALEEWQTSVLRSLAGDDYRHRQ